MFRIFVLILLRRVIYEQLCEVQLYLSNFLNYKKCPFDEMYRIFFLLLFIIGLRYQLLTKSAL